jgi:hypothetical protein
MDKRIIFILGGKGGTGKTLFCRLLYFFLHKSGKNCLGFDADIENPEFSGYHANSPHPVNRLNFLEVSQAKEFFTQLNKVNPTIVVVDMPGASGKATREQWERFGIFRLCENMGYRVTLATILNNSYNPIDSLDIMQDFCQESVDYLVVLNKIWEQGALNFNRWLSSKARNKFLELGGIEIEMPMLESSTMDELHEGAYSFFDISKLNFGDKILVESFLFNGEHWLRKAGNIIGLSAPAVTAKENRRSNSKAKGEQDKGDKTSDEAPAA